MAEVVNLRGVRKAKAKAEARAQANANAARFGRTKAEKARDKAQADKAARDHDGHKRDGD
jgi:hypothetical protein